jgi:ABC-type Fe3+-hydroxamate transport system substrate-binding protein
MTAGRRIVSLVPSMTHTISELGLERQIVGCTNFCVEPPRLARQVKLVGGTKDPDLEAIRALKPTHILTNDEENRLPDIDALRDIAPVFRSLPRDVRGVAVMLEAVGDFLGTPTNAMRYKLNDAMQRLENLVTPAQDVPYLYFIWRDPWMVVSEDTYIAAMLGLIGWKTISDGENRYPTVDLGSDAVKSAQNIILASEPYPFRKRDLPSFIGATRAKFWKADGRLLSWHGAMTIQCIDQLTAFALGRPQELMVPLS